MIPSIPRPSGSTPSTSAPCRSRSSARDLEPFFEQAGFACRRQKRSLAVTPLIRERIKLLRDAVSAADFFFLEELAPYDPAELIPPKGGDAALARRVLEHALAGSARRPPSITIRWTRRCARLPLRSASRPGPCSSPSGSPSADARMRRRCLKPWLCWAARFASSASARPKPTLNRSVKH